MLGIVLVGAAVGPEQALHHGLPGACYVVEKIWWEPKFGLEMVRGFWTKLSQAIGCG